VFAADALKPLCKYRYHHHQHRLCRHYNQHKLLFPLFIFLIPCILIYFYRNGSSLVNFSDLVQWRNILGNLLSASHAIRDVVYTLPAMFDWFAKLQTLALFS
jgi:hypothetical protein